MLLQPSPFLRQQRHSGARTVDGLLGSVMTSPQLPEVFLGQKLVVFQHSRSNLIFLSRIAQIDSKLSDSYDLSQPKIIKTWFEFHSKALNEIPEKHILTQRGFPRKLLGRQNFMQTFQLHLAALTDPTYSGTPKKGRTAIYHCFYALFYYIYFSFSIFLGLELL